MNTINKQQSGLRALALTVLALLTPATIADVGTAGVYNPPYTPTACGGYDASQFPSSNLFACVGDGIWDNGAACGRQYLVRCISASVSGTCKPGNTIQVKVVDNCGPEGRNLGGTLVLSTTAYDAIADRGKSGMVNVEFLLV